MTEEFKLVVMGGGGVGKSALTIRLVSGRFANQYDPTIEDSYRKQATIDGETHMLEILDTAGQEEFAALRDEWIRDSMGYILVYSIVKKSTFDDLALFHKLILRIKEDDLDKIAVVLVGNKCDLEDNREVTQAEGQKMASQWDSQDDIYTKFFEASAKKCINNEEIYYECVRMLRDGRPNSKSQTQETERKCNCVIL